MSVANPTGDKFDLTDMTDEVMRQVPGCRRVLVRKALVEAVRDFCRRTHAWTRQLPTLENCGGRSAVFMLSNSTIGVCDCPEGSVGDDTVWDDLAIFCDDKPVHEPVPDDVEIVSIIGGDHCVAFDIGQRQFMVQGTPRGKWSVALMPTTHIIPKFLVDRHREAFREGALFELFGITGTAWADANARQESFLEFERYWQAEKASVARGHSTAPLRRRSGLKDAP